MKCRICKSPNLSVIMDLGMQSLSGRFAYNHEPDPPKYPLILMKCNGECGLVQLQDTVSSDELYCHSYGYRTGLNKTMTSHIQELVKEIEGYIDINSDDVVLDIGSNDATLLKSYNVNCKKVGIDPTGLQFKEFYTDDIKLNPTFFNAKSYNSITDKKAKVITSISMFYDLEDPIQFMKDVKSVLADGGIWITEQSYILSMLNKNSFDTICHEHLEYYALKQIKYMADKVGLKILKVNFNECNGGSFRIYLSATDYIPDDNLNSLYALENDIESLYPLFVARCEKIKQNLHYFLTNIKQFNKTIYLYGASTKGNVLLQYVGLDNTVITAAADRNVEKHGRRTPGTNIPIVSEDEMRSVQPDFLLVLPWHFRTEFIEREKRYLHDGGQIIFPLPEFEIYSSRPKAFITGINGQIGKYLTDSLLSDNYNIYGLVHNNIDITCDSVTYMKDDLCNIETIKTIIKMINPSEIYNLAGETGTDNSILYPEHTLDVNARVVMGICETIKNTSTKFFQACSCEMYKGAVSEPITEDNISFYPLTPYGISKVAAYWIVRYYRERYNMSCFNGILCTTESKYRDMRYLIRKVINHLKTSPKEALYVGNVHAYRNILHAFDTVSAIRLIMNHEPTDYIISSEISTQIKDIIKIIYSEFGINIDDAFINKSTGKVMVKIDDKLKRLFEYDERMNIHTDKLKKLGWTPSFNIQQIIKEMIEN